MPTSHISSDGISFFSISLEFELNYYVVRRAPIIQTSLRNTTIFVWITLIVSLLVYVRFCTLVINDITNYLGIACFTVRKKDENGVWRHKDHKA